VTCPEWQYGRHTDCSRLLPASAATVLTAIQAGKYPVTKFAQDTRPIHLTLFTGLTPHGFDYYAGNYRGSHHICLKTYEVKIVGDSLVGTKAAKVKSEIERLGKLIVSSVDKIDKALGEQIRPMTPAQRTVAVVKLACSAFVSFLTVHPYADGNGHTARALLWLLLFRFGYVPSGWTIDPRPSIPDYGALIAQHRRGVRDPLEQYVLQRISMVRPLSR
jgi:fido (protein-threonine AMPylation protein)